MIHLLASTARRQVLLAVFIGSVLGTILGGALILARAASVSIAQSLPTPPSVTVSNSQSSVPSSASPTSTVNAAVVATPSLVSRNSTQVPSSTRTPLLSAKIRPIQSTVWLRGLRHDYQRFNNCGPTTLAMNLSYYGRSDTQADIASFTKPDPQDKNVGPDELAEYANHVGMQSIIRVNGTLDQLRLLLSNDIPVIVETGLIKEPQGWMGHYRLVVGYDAQQFITMDSYDGPSLKISFKDLDAVWREFSRLYIVIYSKERDALVRTILADVLDDPTMYELGIAQARAESQADAQDAFAQFNLGTNLTGLGRYAEAAAAFDRARARNLPWRMMWYQFEPFEAYLRIKQTGKALDLANEVLSKAENLEEAHYYKGLALAGLGRSAEARKEFTTALQYNKNFRLAQKALGSH